LDDFACVLWIAHHADDDAEDASLVTFGQRLKSRTIARSTTLYEVKVGRIHPPRSMPTFLDAVAS
jgi:hypothetical protein